MNRDEQIDELNRKLLESQILLRATEDAGTALKNKITTLREACTAMLTYLDDTVIIQPAKKWQGLHDCTELARTALAETDKCPKCGGAGRYYVSYAAMMDRNSTACEECARRWNESPEGTKVEITHLQGQIAKLRRACGKMLCHCVKGDTRHEHCAVCTSVRKVLLNTEKKP